MQVHRSAHARNFTVLPNAVLQDRRLSFAARGLLADLLSRPERWREDARQIADSSTNSRAAVRKALKELIEAGYYRVDTVRLPDGTIRSEAHVYDTPQIPGLEEAKKLLEAVKPQVEPSVPRPASGAADSGDAGVPVVKNLIQEPSLPARGDGEGCPAAPPARRPRPKGGRAVASLADLDDGPLRAAALALYRVLKDQPRLRLGEAEVIELAPLVVRWLAVGCGPAELAAALLPGLPETIHSPARVVRERLERKMPPALEPQEEPAPRAHECAKCRAPMQRSGLCRPCAGLPEPVLTIGGGAACTAAGVARVRAAMRSAGGDAGAIAAA
ncbi:helix-turn-helix domain-containing protein [Kitasatospora aureofaciens]|uniref:helix-turn-helix domain-containing protein n=1 Tax=Kitasatospora aureofaciens TaxID=1894 RepID=UPI001C44BB7C|nr:helix-turn-helix domain-containing protein [Kitasatospora aureofaciens]MBV6695596.1 helix-turn-helix domain-containing protein [Kitasatospora aureofaciens]